MVISAFYSALRGGRMFAEGLINLAAERGLMELLPCHRATPFDFETSYLDEILGYSVAAAGFSFQIFNGFQLPFPLNLLLLPLTVVEWVLRIQISMPGSAGGGTPLPVSG